MIVLKNTSDSNRVKKENKQLPFIIHRLKLHSIITSIFYDVINYVAIDLVQQSFQCNSQYRIVVKTMT